MQEQVGVDLNNQSGKWRSSGRKNEFGMALL